MKENTMRAVNAINNFELIKILSQDLESEIGAIEQYKEHLKYIVSHNDDKSMIAKINEIISDEQDHYNILQNMINELKGD